MNALRAAVVGAGYMGSFHAHKYAESAETALTAIVDRNLQQASKLAQQYGASPLSSHRHLIGQVDIASVAVPTQQHHQVVRELLQDGIHVLVEKPFTATVQQAQDLMELAARQRCVVQVGHIERFNAVIPTLLEYLSKPSLIEARRIVPLQVRGTDVNVVLDLMIHDLDLVCSLVQRPVQELQASGACVLSPQPDVAHARLLFDNGCVANFTASRLSQVGERQLRVYQADNLLEANLQRADLTIYQNGQETQDQLVPHARRIQLSPRDALQAEIAAFVDCVRSHQPPLVGPREGLQAVELACRVSQQILASQRQSGFLPPSFAFRSKA